MWNLCPIPALNRNIVQCLQDYDIPLYLSHTITDIQGHKRVEKAIVSKVDANRKPIPGTEIEFDCDTILLSVGLIPENELSRGVGIQIDPRTKGLSSMKIWKLPWKVFLPAATWFMSTI